MSRRCFTIYCLTCRVNGKKYVGQTIRSAATRWRVHVADAHRGRDHCRLLARAIRKYGSSEFDLIVLQTRRTARAADAAERRWIRRLKARVPTGYNLDAGGRVEPGKHHSTLRRLGKSLRIYWARLTSEEKAKLSQKMTRAMLARWRALTPTERARRVARFRATYSPESVAAAWRRRWATDPIRCLQIGRAHV